MWFTSPVYAAEITCLPAGRAVVSSFATAPFSSTTPSDSPPAKNSTLPLGAPPATVAVNTAGSPTPTVAAAGASEVLVPARSIDAVTAGELASRYAPSPA
nr:hypothetical protein [Leucobacter luti]